MIYVLLVIILCILLSQEGDLTYTLYGVLVHAGWSTHSGHYFSFVRTSSGIWYSLDDNRVGHKFLFKLLCLFAPVISILFPGF